MELPHLSIPNAVAGIFALLFFFYALFTRFGAHRKRRLPPEAGGAWPVIGHLHLLSSKEPVDITLGKMADAYGPIFTLRLGKHRTLIVSSWEIARECFTTNDRIFASRPKSAAGKLLGYDYAMIGVSFYGPHWRHVRKIATLEVLTNHRLEQLQHIRTSEVRSSIKKLHEFWVSSSSNEGGENVSVEMGKWFENITLNTIFRTVVGKQFSAAFDGSGNEHYRKAMKDFFQLFVAFVPSDSFPFLKWFDLGGHEKAMKKTAKVLDEVFDKWLREHRQRRNSGDEETDDLRDFMDVMLSTVKDGEELYGYDADTIIKATCLSLILAGSDTTATTMIRALSLLLDNQEVLKRVQLELDEQVGRQRQVEELDVKNLIYLRAIVKETMRLVPAASFSIPHESSEDCTVAGYHVSAGTRLLVNIQKLQRDPLVWEDPCEFRPERFLTSEKDFDVKGQSPQFIPFGSGRRMCPGSSFALQVIHLTLANLLHWFEIGRPPGELSDTKESIEIETTNNSRKSLEVIFTPRLQAQVYE